MKSLDRVGCRLGFRKIDAKAKEASARPARIAILRQSAEECEDGSGHVVAPLRRHALLKQNLHELLQPFHGQRLVRTKPLADIQRQVKGNEGMARRLSRLQQKIEELLEVRKRLLDGLALALDLAVLILVVVLVLIVVVVAIIAIVIVVALALAARRAESAALLPEGRKDLPHEAGPAAPAGLVTLRCHRLRPTAR